MTYGKIYTMDLSRLSKIAYRLARAVDRYQYTDVQRFAASSRLCTVTHMVQIKVERLAENFTATVGG